MALLDSLTFNPSTVTSQNRTVGTIRLTAAAPAGGASVSLSSSNTDLARVPSNVSIPAGSTSNVVNIDVPSVDRDTAVTITATYAGLSRTGTLTITPPPLEPRFTVISVRKGADACAIDGADGHIDCEFDGSRSFGAIERYFWKLTIGEDRDEFRHNTTSPKTTVSPNCTYWNDGSANKTVESFNVDVELRLRGKDGREGAGVTRTVKVYPQKNCGYN